MLYIASMNNSEPYQASVYSLMEDEVICEVGVEALDPTPEGDSVFMNVIVKGYEISYYRKDTGKSVPETFTGNTNTICTVGGTSSFSMIICRASQKEMPPLQDLCDPGYDQETGLFEIHTTCRAIVWGDTFAGEEVVSKTAQMTVNFACQWSTI